MKRQHQVPLIATTLGFSWLAMQVVHELAHVTAASATGGRVAEVKLHSLAISHTLLAENTRPVFVAWMGPIVGAALPLLAWWVVHWLTVRGAYIWRFFAGFCLLANGACLAAGSFYDAGDAGDLMCFGTPQSLIWLFGLVTIVSGFWLWNGIGRHFGLGSDAEAVDRSATFVVTLLLFTIIVLELAFD